MCCYTEDISHSCLVLSYINVLQSNLISFVGVAKHINWGWKTHWNTEINSNVFSARALQCLLSLKSFQMFLKMRDDRRTDRQAEKTVYCDATCVNTKNNITQLYSEWAPQTCSVTMNVKVLLCLLGPVPCFLWAPLCLLARHSSLWLFRVSNTLTAANMIW